MPIKLSLKLVIVFVGVFLLLASSIAYAGFGGGFRADAGPVPPPPDMVSWWPGDGNTDDIVGGNDGTLEGDATYTTGIVGPGFRLDGTGDYVLVPDSDNLTITGDITIDAWIKYRPGAVFQNIVTKFGADPDGGGPAYVLRLVSGDKPSAQVLFGVYEDKDRTIHRVLKTDTGVVPAGRPTHIAGTFDLATQDMKIYVNGREVAATLTPPSTVITSIFPSNSPVRIGATRPVSGEVSFFFEGVIDEVEIFNRALTGDEVRSIFSARRAGKIKPLPTPTPGPGPIPPPPDMVGWWPGDGNTNDIIGGNDGTLLNGATFDTGMVDQAFSLDGVDDVLEVPDDPSLDFGTNDFTVDAWINVDGSLLTPQTEIGIVNKNSFYENAPGWTLQLTTWGEDLPEGEFNVTFWMTNLVWPADTYVVTSGDKTSGVWHHVAVLREGDTTRLYFDGVLEDETVSADTALDVDNNEPVMIGAHSWGPTFPGLIDEVELFDRALTDAEILAIYEAGSDGKIKPPPPPPPEPIPPPPDMVGWWPGDGNANDIIGSNDGTLQNGAKFDTGKVDQAFSLDGFDDFVEVADDPSLDFGTGDFTVDAWINVDESLLTSVEIGVINKNSFYQNTPGWTIEVSTFGEVQGQFHVSFWLTNLVWPGDTVVGTSGSQNSGVWHHLAVVRQGQTTQMYFDGVIHAETLSGSVLNVDNNEPVIIGDHSWGPNFPGLIDEVEIFNRALTEVEINAIFEAGSAGKTKP